jgi:hypothetical protein
VEREHFKELEMFQVCQIESNISTSRAVFTFKTSKVSRSLIFDSPDKWTSTYDEHQSTWNSKDAIAFLFLLERPFEDLIQLFKNAEEIIGDGQLTASFPSNGIVLMALNDNGEYWMDLALKWMDYPQFQFGSELLERVKTLAFRKTRNQKLQHRFMKLYARLKRDGLMPTEQS